MIQKYSYLYLDSQANNVPKNWLDVYKAKTPFLKVNTQIESQVINGDVKMADVFTILTNEGYLDTASDGAIARAKELMTETQAIDISLFNNSMTFLPEFSDSTVSTDNTGSYALSRSAFLTKCQSGEVGININAIKQIDGTYKYYIINDEAYKYFYKNRNYLTIGTYSNLIVSSTPYNGRTEFEHNIMKLHLLADADGRKVVDESGKPKYPDFVSYFSTLLNDSFNPFKPLHWDDNDQSNDDAVDVYTSLSTRIGSLLGYSSISAPIIKRRFYPAEITRVSTTVFYYYVDISPLNYINAKEALDVKVFVENGSSVKENKYAVSYAYSSDISRLYIYYESDAKLGDTGSIGYIDVYF